MFSFHCAACVCCIVNRTRSAFLFLVRLDGTFSHVDGRFSFRKAAHTRYLRDARSWEAVWERRGCRWEADYRERVELSRAFLGFIIRQDRQINGSLFRIESLSRRSLTIIQIARPVLKAVCCSSVAFTNPLCNCEVSEVPLANNTDLHFLWNYYWWASTRYTRIESVKKQLRIF